MPNAYSQVYLQFVFAVYCRQSLIPPQRKEALHRYITSLVEHRKSKMLAIHCMPDHTHLFVGFNPEISISDFIKEIKVESNQFINTQKWMPGKFTWQKGYGVFSYVQSQKDAVINYVMNQELHHRKKTFRSEYIELLQRFKISYEERFLFEFLM